MTASFDDTELYRVRIHGFNFTDMRTQSIPAHFFPSTLPGYQATVSTLSLAACLVETTEVGSSLTAHTAIGSSSMLLVNGVLT